MLALAALERREAGVDRRGERGAAARDDAHLDRVEALEERARSRASAGHCRNAVPAKATSAEAVAVRRRHQVVHRRAWRAPGGSASRRSASMLREVSSAITRSMPSRCTCCQRKPHIGPASATTRAEPTAARAAPARSRPAPRVDVGRDDRLQDRRDERGERPLPAAPCPHEERGEPGHQSRAPRGSSGSRHWHHGSFRSTRLAEPDLEQEEAERRPHQPGIELAVVEELRRLERRLLGAVDLVVDLAQALGVGGAEVARAGRRRDLLAASPRRCRPASDGRRCCRRSPSPGTARGPACRRRPCRP